MRRDAILHRQLAIEVPLVADGHLLAMELLPGRPLAMPTAQFLTSHQLFAVPAAELLAGEGAVLLTAVAAELLRPGEATTTAVPLPHPGEGAAMLGARHGKALRMLPARHGKAAAMAAECREAASTTMAAATAAEANETAAVTAATSREARAVTTAAAPTAAVLDGLRLVSAAMAAAGLCRRRARYRQSRHARSEE
jgi:hypothetical protein